MAQRIAPTHSSPHTTMHRAHALTALLILSLLATVTGSGVAVGEEAEIKGYYQDYVYAVPDNPSQAWTLSHGGRIYDMWWAALGNEPPYETHPAYPASGPLKGPDTWRCVSCHGWDYKGTEGVAGGKKEDVGIKGVRAMAGADPKRIAGIIRDPAHGYTPDMISDDALLALAAFVSQGQHDADEFIGREDGKVRGQPEAGRAVFQNLCAICHDFDGLAWISGEDVDLQTLGAVAASNPWQALHKLRNGQPSADMPAMRAFDLQTVLNVLSYAQTLPLN